MHLIFLFSTTMRLPYLRSPGISKLSRSTTFHSPSNPHSMKKAKFILRFKSSQLKTSSSLSYFRNPSSRTKFFVGGTFLGFVSLGSLKVALEEDLAFLQTFPLLAIRVRALLLQGDGGTQDDTDFFENIVDWAESLGGSSLKLQLLRLRVECKNVLATPRSSQNENGEKIMDRLDEIISAIRREVHFFEEDDEPMPDCLMLGVKELEGLVNCLGLECFSNGEKHHRLLGEATKAFERLLVLAERHETGSGENPYLSERSKRRVARELRSTWRSYPDLELAAAFEDTASDFSALFLHEVVVEDVKSRSSSANKKADEKSVWRQLARAMQVDDVLSDSSDRRQSSETELDAQKQHDTEQHFHRQSSIHTSVDSKGERLGRTFLSKSMPKAAEAMRDSRPRKRNFFRKLSRALSRGGVKTEEKDLKRARRKRNLPSPRKRVRSGRFKSSRFGSLGSIEEELDDDFSSSDDYPVLKMRMDPHTQAVIVTQTTALLSGLGFSSQNFMHQVSPEADLPQTALFDFLEHLEDVLLHQLRAFRALPLPQLLAARFAFFSHKLVDSVEQKGRVLEAYQNQFRQHLLRTLVMQQVCLQVEKFRDFIIALFPLVEGALGILQTKLGDIRAAAPGGSWLAHSQGASRRQREFTLINPHSSLYVVVGQLQDFREHRSFLDEECGETTNSEVYSDSEESEEHDFLLSGSLYFGIGRTPRKSPKNSSINLAGELKFKKRSAGASSESLKNANNSVSSGTPRSYNILSDEEGTPLARGNLNF